MLIPLIVLSIGAVFAGFAFHHPFIYPEEGLAFWNGSLAFDAHLMHATHEVPLWVKWTPFTVMVIGLFLAWNSYIRNTDAAGALRRAVRAAAPVPVQQMVFRRAVQHRLREARLRDRPLLLEARR